MASGRVYRDYLQFEEDASTAPPPRSHPLQKRPNGSALLETIIAENEFDSETAENFNIIPSKLSRLTEDDKATSLQEDADLQAEPVLHESQIALRSSRPVKSPKAMIAIPADVKPYKQRASSASTVSRPHVETRGSFSSPNPPPPRASNRPYANDQEMGRGQRYTPASSDGGLANKMPEFFSYTVFQIVLQNPTIAHQLLRFAQSRLAGESLMFLERLSSYYTQLHTVSKTISEIHKEFLSPNADVELNVSESAVTSARSRVQKTLQDGLPKLEFLFADVKSEIEDLVFQDMYPKFVRHQMTVSAAKALGSDRSKYAGLGDCFVLTDPNKADNPVVFVSDGFVKVTGYRRNEIIPRNCRFVQSEQTDQEALRRIKDALTKREESVELILNRRKTGEPFWNLLYITPLFDNNGKLAFFLGGQINCSTTIHSTSDVLRILAQSRDGEDDNNVRPFSAQTIKQPLIRRLGRGSNKVDVQQRLPGQEDNLVAKLGNMDLENQLKSFHSAYSHFVVINYSTMLIAFASNGLIDLLFPIKARTAYQALAVGTDIFKFLGNHGSGSVSWDFKAAVKSALKSGQPISLDLKLCARPLMQLERFQLHFTPLKNETAEVVWVVLTMGNEQRA